MGQWVRRLGALALIGLWGPTSINALWGYSLGAALVFLSQLTFFRRHITTGISAVSQAASNTANWAAKLTDYAHPFASWGLFTWAQMASDRWAVEIFASTAQVGLYTALYQIGFYPVTLLSTAMVQFAAPILFSRAGDGKVPARIAQTARLIWLLLAASLGATLVGTIFSWFFHDFIFSLFVPIQYRSISFLLPVTVLAGGLFAAGQVAVLQVLSSSASRSLIAPKNGTAILGVILNFAGVYWFGLPGLVWAGAVFALVYLGWILCLCRSQAGTVPVDPESSKTL